MIRYISVSEALEIIDKEYTSKEHTSKEHTSKGTIISYFVKLVSYSFNEAVTYLDF